MKLPEKIQCWQESLVKIPGHGQWVESDWEAVPTTVRVRYYDFLCEEDKSRVSKVLVEKCRCFDYAEPKTIYDLTQFNEGHKEYK